MKQRTSKTWRSMSYRPIRALLIKKTGDLIYPYSKAKQASNNNSTQLICEPDVLGKLEIKQLRENLIRACNSVSHRTQLKKRPLFTPRCNRQNERWSSDEPLFTR